ncbi:MAG: hypothetical protein R6V49_05265, partial [Bacteroidales bacterium]
YLPTVHGFDEFFGNLYHLNAEEEPENVDYPPEAISCNGASIRKRMKWDTSGLKSSGTMALKYP